MVTHTPSPLDILFGKTRRGVLGLLYARPTERFHLRQIGRLTGAGMGTLQRELRALTLAGIVARDTEGVHVFYRANAALPGFEELTALMRKMTPVAEAGPADNMEKRTQADGGGKGVETRGGRVVEDEFL